ncbi:MAG: Mur ligase family protein [Candidatus Paceibacterota bacterium]|jgi:UDP-N-acetylmuramate: L-alanyl-gamma-D-glutamyl-meso-diaminopimelate ligase
MNANEPIRQAQSIQKLPKKLHVIGICGVATSALAIAFHKRGVVVTGSDKGFFPPVSTELEKQGISYYAGWHPEKMFGGLLNLNSPAVPDEKALQGGDYIVIIGTASGSANPETILAKEKGIPTYSYPEVIGKYFAKEKSIVCSGTWGKTSSSALLSFILEQSKLDPTYMFGGISLSHESSAKLTSSNYSIFEGDEYKSSPTDLRAKFFHYKATHLLLSAVSWDHADLYPTEKEYFEAFNKLIVTIPHDGMIVACADHEGAMRVVKSFKGKTILYGRELPEAKKIAGYYGYKNVAQTKEGLILTITHEGVEYKINSPMLGLYQSENITGCFAMANSLGIPVEKIIKAISLFKGLKRRMEKRLESKVTIIDDIAHSPEKASSVLNTLRSIYSEKIVVVFEPNIGGRSRESIVKYDNAFNDADIVIIPRLTKLKVSEDEKEQPMEGDELASTIRKTHSHVEYMEDDEKLVTFLTSETKKGDVIAFLGSHGFRGMIEETTKRIDSAK